MIKNIESNHNHVLEEWSHEKQGELEGKVEVIGVVKTIARGFVVEELIKIFVKHLWLIIIVYENGQSQNQSLLSHSLM